MPPSREDDLDWLYGRPSAPDPEPTRVFIPEADSVPPPASTAVRQPPPSPPGPPPGPPLPPTQPPSAPRLRRRRRPARTVFALLGLLVALALVGLVAVPLYAWSRVPRVEAAPDGSRPADQPGTTFLLVGSDSREGLTKAQRKELGTGGTAGQRTDTIMLVSLPERGQPALLSLPRDSYVPVPGHGRNKINAAYAFGGPQLLVSTVEEATGVRVDGYAEIGFGGFVRVIDALGGIRMCLPKAISDRDSHVDLPAGCQTLGGADALGYVRMRKADKRGDLGRVERQREMLAAVAAKAASPATVLNPIRYARTSTAAAAAVSLGKDTSAGQTLAFARAMRRIAGGDGLTLTVPVSNPDAATPVGSAVLWDETKAKSMFAELAKGDTTDLKKYAE